MPGKLEDMMLLAMHSERRGAGDNWQEAGLRDAGTCDLLPMILCICVTVWPAEGYLIE
jgi:hypothetical protein